MIEEKRNMVCGALSIALGASVLLLGHSQIPQVVGIKSIGISPKTMPYLCAVLFIILGLFPFFTYFIKTRNRSPLGKENRSIPQLDKLISVITIFILVFCYNFIMIKLGFLIATFLFLFTIMIYIGYKTKPIMLILIVFLVPNIIYFLFEIILNVSLP